MRKLILAALITASLFSFCACGGDRSDNMQSTVEKAEAEVAPGPEIQPMSEEEIEKVEAAFSVMLGEPGEMVINPLNCFLMSYHDSPEEFDMAAFLRYFPGSEEGSEAEFEALRALPGWTFADLPSMADMPVPLRCYPGEKVRDALEKYAGLYMEDVDISPEAGVWYLPEYDAFYNYTSDFGLEQPDYYRGERQGDVLRLWQDHPYEGERVLTVRELENGYRVIAHQKVEVE